MSLYLCLDESGKLHPNDSCRYFVIGGYLTDDYQKVGVEYRRIVGKYKKKYKIDARTELKGSSIKYSDKRKIIDAMKEKCFLEYCAIVIDKETFRSDKTKENEFYNYFIKLLLHYLRCTKKVSTIISTNEIKLRLDNRTIKTRYAQAIDGYLRTEFVTRYNQNMDFSSKFLDSQNNYEIQLADVVSNYLYGGFNRGNYVKKRFEDRHISYMPYKNFGG